MNYVMIKRWTGLLSSVGCHYVDLQGKRPSNLDVVILIVLTTSQPTAGPSLRCNSQFTLN